MAVYERPYIIINGKSSEEITGLMICSLPPISKPAMRVSAEEIDGRNGDIVTELGYSAYDKEIEIGLSGNYDVDDVIAYFNTSGQVIFSNEPDKYYRFSIYNGIDFEKLIRFKRATVTFHVQPFKFATENNDAVFYSPDSVSITNEGNIYSRPELAIQGSGDISISVNGSEAVDISLGETQQAIIIDSEGMNAYGTKSNIKNLEVDINPVQDLNGYDHPWIGGAGKNKLNMVDVLPSGSYVDNTFECSSFSNRPTVSLFSEPTNIIFSFKKATFGGSNGRIEFYNGSTLLSSKTLTGENQSDTIQNITAIKFNYSSGGALSIEEPMIRLATVSDATFEPYENICPITGHSGCVVTHTGANVCGGEFLANLIVSTFPNTVKDAINKTVTYTAGSANSRMLFDRFKPNTVYTFFIDTESANTNIAVQYTDGTSMRLYAGINVTESNKSVSYLRGQFQSGTTVLNYEKSGIFEGILTADDFQRYVGNPYSMYFEGLINGTFNYLDLGTLSWSYNSTYDYFYTVMPSDSVANISGGHVGACSKYDLFNGTISAFSATNKKLTYNNSSLGGAKVVAITDSDYTDTTEFQTSLSGVYLIYQLATPTTPTITQAEITMLMNAFGIDETSAIVVFGQEVFGATINITTGLLTIDRIIVELGNLTWYQNGSYNEFRCGISANNLPLPKDYASTVIGKWICSALKSETGNNTYRGTVDHAISINTSYISASDSSCANATEFTTAMNDVQFVYELAQPIEIQLTAQEVMALIGENVIWADTGAISDLTYTKEGQDISVSGDIVSFEVDAKDLIDTIFKNRLVTGDYSNLSLKSGENEITVTGDVSVMVLSNFSRWL